MNIFDLQLGTDSVNEAKARNVRKVKQALTGNNDLIKSWGIITAENPIGMEFPADVNKKRDAALRASLAQANQEYIKVKGQYGNPENSLFVINPSLSDMKKIASNYGQESFIFATNSSDEEGFSFDAGYYEMDVDDAKKDMWKTRFEKNPEYKIETTVPYKKSITKNRIINQKDADDFFTSIASHGRKFKFQIPFFESTIRHAFERMVLLTEGKDLEHVKYELKRITTDANSYSEGSRWRIRGSLYHRD